jgi:hypothetical protein
MGGFYKDKAGNYTIRFVGADRKRHSIRLGKVSLRDVREIRVKVHALAVTQITGITIDFEVARWVQRIGDGLHAKLARAGFVAA